MANTLMIDTPTANAMATCQANCSNLGPCDPLDKSKLSPRPKREKVREQIKDYILLMLGAPVLGLEFDQQQIDFCVDQAMLIFEEYAPREYFSYYSFLTTPGKSVYEMPPDIGLIRNVVYKRIASSAFQAKDLGGVIPIEFYTNASSALNGGLFSPNEPIWGRMGEFALYKGYEDMFARESSQLGGFEFIGGTKCIKLYPVPYNACHVAVHYIQQNKDWGKVSQALQEGALTYAKEIVGRIRGRIKNPPGPNGGISLDGDQLIQEAREDRKQWFEDLIFKFGDLPYISMG